MKTLKFNVEKKRFESYDEWRPTRSASENSDINTIRKLIVEVYIENDIISFLLHHF